MKQPSEDRANQHYVGQLVIAVVWSLAVSVVSAQEYYQGYRFAPPTPAPLGGAGELTYGGDIRPTPDSDWTESSPLLTAPGGRPYRFRNGYEPQQQSQHPVFRPDTQLGQQPKNWSSDPGWASDPVLQQGLVFRPLSKKGNGAGRRESRAPAATPVAPPGYPYVPGAGLGIYPGLYGPGISDDPVTGAPLWPVPGTFGGWMPAW